MRSRTLPTLFVALAPAALAPAQTAEELFTEGTVLLGGWSCARHTIDLDGVDPPDALGWWWQPGSNGQYARVVGWTGDGAGGLRTQWQFDTPNPGGSGLSLNGSAVGDFDGDGDDDFVVGIWWHGHVYTREGLAQPTYYGDVWYPWDSTAWHHPLGMLATDCNGDGRDEIITATPKALRIFRNDGPIDGFEISGWELLIDAEPHTLLDEHIEILLGDVDGDPSRQELIVLRGGQGEVELRTYRMSGATFAAPAIYPLDVAPGSHVAMADIDGDQDDDLVVFDEAGAFQVLRRTMPSSFQVEPRTIGGPATHFADVDGDGDPDGICCGGGGTPNPQNDQPSTFHVALNDGTGAFAPAATFPGLGSEGIALAADMDGDGDTDLLAGRAILINHLTVGAPYCEAAPNSSGRPASISAQGSASVARADLVLCAGDLPASSVGFFLVGTDDEHLPMADGWLCVSATLGRLPSSPAGQSDATCLPLGDPLHAAALTPEPGDTRYYQYCFRDPGAGANATPGLRVTFAP